MGHTVRDRWLQSYHYTHSLPEVFSSWTFTCSVCVEQIDQQIRHDSQEYDIDKLSNVCFLLREWDCVHNVCGDYVHGKIVVANWLLRQIEYIEQDYN